LTTPAFEHHHWHTYTKAVTVICWHEWVNPLAADGIVMARTPQPRLEEHQNDAEHQLDDDLLFQTITGRPGCLPHHNDGTGVAHDNEKETYEKGYVEEVHVVVLILFVVDPAPCSWRVAHDTNRQTNFRRHRSVKRGFVLENSPLKPNASNVAGRMVKMSDSTHATAW